MENTKRTGTSATKGMHRINKEDEDKINAEVRLLIEEREDMTPEQIDVARKRQTAYRAFLKKYQKARSLNFNYKNPIPLRICWENLEELMKSVDMDYRHLLEVVSVEKPGEKVELTWPDSDTERVAYLCDHRMDDKQRKRVLATARSITPDWIVNLIEDKLPPLTKLFGYTTNISKRGYTRNVIKGSRLEIAYNNNNTKAQESALYHSMIFPMSTAYGISMHYMLSLDSSKTILAEHGETEMIVDYYCLMLDLNKNVFKHTLEKYFG